MCSDLESSVRARPGAACCAQSWVLSLVPAFLWAAELRVQLCHDCQHLQQLLFPPPSSWLKFLCYPLARKQQAAEQGLSLSQWGEVRAAGVLLLVFDPRLTSAALLPVYTLVYLQPPFTCPGLVLSGAWLLRNSWQALSAFLKDSQLWGAVHLFQRTRWIKAHGFLVTLRHSNSSCSRAFSEWSWSHQMAWRRKMQKTEQEKIGVYLFIYICHEVAQGSYCGKFEENGRKSFSEGLINRKSARTKSLISAME